MEPIRVYGPLRRDRIRRVRAGNSHSARAAAADPCLHAACENIFACLGHLCARAKLDLFASALAELLIQHLFQKVCFKNTLCFIVCAGVNVINTLP